MNSIRIGRRGVAGRPALLAALAVVLSWGCATTAVPESGKPRQVDEFHWSGVERIIAVGDLHGDHEQFERVMQEAGLINRRGKWTGGSTHLVQTGDIVDRGPSSREIINDLLKLQEQAEKDGGRVHLLIGNHEAMNVYGDLRYVDPGEFAAFADRGSGRMRDRYYDGWMAQMRDNDPEGYALLMESQPNHREQWMAEHPEGWVEHRIAWHTSGEYGQWVMGNPVAVRVNDTFFLHGGVSQAYCAQGAAGMTGAVHDALQSFNSDDPGILTDDAGPLWYRGLAMDDETAAAESVAGIMDCLGVERIVIGHTVTAGPIWPRFNGSVVQIDTGIGAHYGGHTAWLEITTEGAWANYPGLRLPLPDTEEARLSYLDELITRYPDNRYLTARRDALISGTPDSPVTTGTEEVAESAAE